MQVDAIIVGGGPAGLQAALTLGRARKRVLLCDSGPRRNAKAERVYTFVTRDGTPPDEFRAVAREQLRRYPSVEVQDARVESLRGSKGAFVAQLSSGQTVEAKRIVLCVGMIDQMLPIEGFRELWGHSLFQCPYCHGWELQDRAWGYLARPENAAHLLPFVLQLRGWTERVTLFTQGSFELDAEPRQALEAAGVTIEAAPLRRLIAKDGTLQAVELAGPQPEVRSVACDALFVHPPQLQTPLILELGLQLDDDGFVHVDPMRRETSIPGIYAAGDLTSRMQSALMAASAAMHAASMLNLELTQEQLTRA